MVFNAGDEIGPYRIVRALGKGGFGAVYEVLHTTLGVKYALKTFALESGHVDLFRKRFVAEGKVLARLNHPSIVRVFDMDILEDGALAYFVMDLVHYKDGESYTMADVEVGGADNGHLVRWFGQLASALDYIHDVGIVHRDIKLNNILLNDKGGVMLSDFGISKFTGEKIRSEVDVTRTRVSVAGKQVTGNFIMGTEGYMAPEILRGESATMASDVYALGVTFFRLLTGMWYEPGTNAFWLLEPLDGIWSEILPKMLADDPARRPTHLEPLAEQLALSVSSVVQTPSTVARSITLFRRIDRRVVLRIVASVVGVLLAVGSGLGVYRLLFGEGTVPQNCDAQSVKQDVPNVANKGGESVRELSSEPQSFDLAQGVRLELGYCPAGTFLMSGVPGVAGDKKHEVNLTRSFWIADECVNTRMYRAFDATYQPKDAKKDLVQGRKCADAYVRWLNEKFASELPSGYVFRLPTEAEWEYAYGLGKFAKHWEFEGMQDTVVGLFDKPNAWRGNLSVLKYETSETDPLRVCEKNAVWVCRQNAKRFLLRLDGPACFRVVVGPDLLSEKRQ